MASSKPTVIRGITVRPGSVVYSVFDTTLSNAVRRADPDEETLEEYAPAIRAHNVAATNGASFAFVRKKVLCPTANSRAPWSYVARPERYCVTREEAEAELSRVRSGLLEIAEKMLPHEEEEVAEAQAELDAAKARVERLRASIAALRSGTHPALHYINRQEQPA